MRRQQVTARRGFATLYAIILLGLIVTVLSVTSSILTREMHRTATEMDSAQLRVLLRWSADDMLVRANGSPAKAEGREFVLPAALAGWKVEGRFEPDKAGAVAVMTLRAASPNRIAMTETLRLARAGAGWTVVSAEAENSR